MTLKDSIREANRTEDARRIRVIMEKLRIKWGMNYRESAEFFARCDPTIDAARYEELCQIADAVCY